MSKVKLKKIGNPGFVKEESGVEKLKKDLEILTKVKGVEEVIVYMVDGKNNNDYRTRYGEMSVFVQAVPKEENDLVEIQSVLDVNGDKREALELKVEGLEKDVIKVKDDSGTLLAYVIEDSNSIYIPYIIEKMPFNESMDIVGYIASYVYENYYEELENIDSWKKSKQKEELKSRVENYLKKGNEKIIKETEGSLKEAEDRLIRAQSELKRLYDKVIDKRKKLKLAKEDKITGLDSFLSGLDAIAEHEKVENLIVKENNVEVQMKPLKIRANVGGEIKFYELNGAKVKINIDSAEIKFDSDSKYRSHWSAKDPHPHVNGKTGNACLGNVANTIAELASGREIYPLYLICLDFLENANTEDPAGEKVINWKEIVEEEEKKVVKRGRPAKKHAVFTMFVEGGGYHTEVMMTNTEIEEKGVKEYEGDLLMPDVYEKLMKVVGG